MKWEVGYQTAVIDLFMVYVWYRANLIRVWSCTLSSVSEQLLFSWYKLYNNLFCYILCSSEFCKVCLAFPFNLIWTNCSCCVDFGQSLEYWPEKEPFLANIPPLHIIVVYEKKEELNYWPTNNLTDTDFYSKTCFRFWQPCILVEKSLCLLSSQFITLPAVKFPWRMFMPIFSILQHIPSWHNFTQKIPSTHWSVGTNINTLISFMDIIHNLLKRQSMSSSLHIKGSSLPSLFSLFSCIYVLFYHFREKDNKWRKQSPCYWFNENEKATDRT